MVTMTRREYLRELLGLAAVSCVPLKGGAASQPPGSPTRVSQRVGVEAPIPPQGTGRGRRELMLIYSEDLAPSGARVADLVADGRPNERWAPMEAALIERATRAFRVERR